MLVSHGGTVLSDRRLGGCNGRPNLECLPFTETILRGVGLIGDREPSLERVFLHFCIHLV
jgi:hypothetical protein